LHAFLIFTVKNSTEIPTPTLNAHCGHRFHKKLPPGYGDEFPRFERILERLKLETKFRNSKVDPTSDDFAQIPADQDSSRLRFERSEIMMTQSHEINDHDDIMIRNFKSESQI
jgi:hypothetical protein